MACGGRDREDRAVPKEVWADGDAKLWERRLGDDLPNIGVSERAILGEAQERVIGRG